MLARDLATQALAATANDPDGAAWTVEEIYALLDVDGIRNRHLENPQNHSRQGHLRRRDVPLTGQEEVNGEFLALTYCGHDPFVRLDDFPDTDALEMHLLSDSALLNPFIDHVVAFIRGRAASYSILFADRGRCVVRFEKANHMPGPDTSLATAFPSRSIQWHAAT